MEILKKIFGNKGNSTSLMFVLILFEDFDHQRPAKNKDSYNEFALPVMYNLVDLHYTQKLKSKKWTYDYMLNPIDLRDKRILHTEFRDLETKEIKDKSKYKEMCNGIKSRWKEQLIERFPQYDRNALEDGFEKIVFDYFPSKCILAASFLLDDLLNYGVNKFH